MSIYSFSYITSYGLHTHIRTLTQLYCACLNSTQAVTNCAVETVSGCCCVGSCWFSSAQSIASLLPQDDEKSSHKVIYSSTGLWHWVQKRPHVILIAVIWTTCTFLRCPTALLPTWTRAMQPFVVRIVWYVFYIFPMSAIQGSYMSVVLFCLLFIIPFATFVSLVEIFLKGISACWFFQSSVETLWASTLKDFTLVNFPSFPRGRITAQEQGQHSYFSQYLGREERRKEYWDPLLCNWEWLKYKFYESWSKPSRWTDVSFLHTFCM